MGSNPPPSSYLTLAGLRDDGAGQIVCPPRGLMAIERCEEFQRSLNCRCSVYLAYDGGRPDRDVAPAAEAPLAEHLCGRRFDDEIEALRAAARLVPPARLTRGVRKEAPMPTKAKTATTCGRCHQPPPDGTHIFNGLCKPCREKTKAEQKKKDEAAIAAVATKPRPAAAGAHDARQQTLPAVAACELEHLKGQLVERDQTIAKLKLRVERLEWAARGTIAGYIDGVELERLIREGAAA